MAYYSVFTLFTQTQKLIYIYSMIISASRRCDIPRFHFDWFLQRLEAGYVDVVNPFNAAQTRRVSLIPEDVEAFVFWTRDPRSLLAAELERYPFYTMITLTGYPKIFEPNMPPPDEIIQAMKALSEKLGRKRVIWRYDPILFSSLTDAAFHRWNFTELAARLSGVTERVIISVYDEYAGARRRLSALTQDGLVEIFPHSNQDGRIMPELKELAAELALIAAKAGMEMRSCAEAEDLSDLGIEHGACIDGDLIRELLGDRDSLSQIKSKDKNQRQNCLCVSSVDIGSYGSCQAGCVYCYARK
jgi:DNA repair photolyase